MPEQSEISFPIAATGRTLHRVAVLHHPKIEATLAIAQEIVSWLDAHGCAPWHAYTWDEDIIRPELPNTDLIVVLGGDGSTLRAARMAAPQAIPILGLNMGRLGFLSELDPENWATRLPLVLSGQYWLEERMMITAETFRGAISLGRHLALNDVVISRGGLARVVRLRTMIDGDELTTYVADGLIIATPTGSTAYALAAGGPILPPDLRNILLQPIAPHLTLNRAVVLSEGARIMIEVGTDHEAILTVDGQFMFDLQHGDHVIVRASEYASRFVRLEKPAYFYRTLMARLEPKHGC